MLNAICNRQGIVPDTLPGYDHHQSPSLSSHSPSSIGSASVERCHLFNLMRCKQLVNTLEVCIGEIGHHRENMMEAYNVKDEDL